MRAMPTTGFPSGSSTLKLDCAVTAFIGSLKVAVMIASRRTPVSRSTGLVMITRGAMTTGVVKSHVKSMASGVPTMLVASVLTVAV
jgi:hypothetical protein